MHTTHRSRTLMDIDDQNAYSRRTNGTAVFGISSTSDIPSAVKLMHYLEEPIEIEGVSDNSSAPMKRSFSRFPGRKRPNLNLPKRYRPVKSMIKYDTNSTDISYI